MTEIIDYEPPGKENENGNSAPETIKKALESIDALKKKSLIIFGNAINSVGIFAQSYSERINSFIDNLSPTIDRLKHILSSVAIYSKPMLAISELSDAQYVYWDYLDEDLIDELLSTQNTNKFLRLRLEKEKYKSVFETLKKCKNSKIVTNKRLIDQVAFSFENGKNDIAVLGLIALIDDALSFATGDFSTSICNRANPLIDKIENDESIESDEFSILVLLITFRETVESFGKFSDFYSPEEKKLNRHRIAHGHSYKRKTKLDCVKLINFLYGIILLDELSNKRLND